jgi:hypothetical protein
MESIFGGFFDYESKKQLDDYLINGLDKPTALKIIELAIETLQSQGVFSLAESHTLFKCLCKLKENDETI